MRSTWTARKSLDLGNDSAKVRETRQSGQGDEASLHSRIRPRGDSRPRLSGEQARSFLSSASCTLSSEPPRECGQRGRQESHSTFGNDSTKVRETRQRGQGREASLHSRIRPRGDSRPRLSGERARWFLSSASCTLSSEPPRECGQRGRARKSPDLGNDSAKVRETRQSGEGDEASLHSRIGPRGDSRPRLSGERSSLVFWRFRSFLSI